MKLRFILFAMLFALVGKAQTCEAYVSADPPATTQLPNQPPAQRILRLACLDTAGFTVDRSNPARPILKVKPAPGPQGTQGIQGVKGDKGDTGPQGPPGTGTGSGIVGGPCTFPTTHMRFIWRLRNLDGTLTGTCIEIEVVGTTIGANGMQVPGEPVIVAALTTFKASHIRM